MSGVIRSMKEVRGMLAPLAAIGIVGAACAQGVGEEVYQASQTQQDLTVEVRRVLLDTPVVRIVDGQERSISEIVEFKLTVERPIPALSLDPVLVLGGREIPEYHYEEPNVLVFTEFEPDQLPDGEQLVFRWGQAAGEYTGTPTGYRFLTQELETVHRPSLTQRPTPHEPG